MPLATLLLAMTFLLPVGANPDRSKFQPSLQLDSLELAVHKITTQRERRARNKCIRQNNGSAKNCPNVGAH